MNGRADKGWHPAGDPSSGHGAQQAQHPQRLQGCPEGLDAHFSSAKPRLPEEDLAMGAGVTHPDQDSPETSRGSTAYVAQGSESTNRGLVQSQNLFGRASLVRPRLGELLVQAQLLTPQDVDMTLSFQKLSHSKFGEIVVDKRLATTSDVILALAQQSAWTHRALLGDSSQAMAELVMLHAPDGPAANVVRGVAHQLLSNTLRPKPGFSRSLAVVSGDKGDGRTYLAANLAICLALQGQRVVLIEADLDSPRLASMFETSTGQPGLQQVLRGLAPLRSALSVFRAVPNLHLLPAEASRLHPGGLLHQAAMSLLIRSLRNEYDVVLIDTPAFKASTDAMAVAMQCSAAVLVARTGQSQISDLRGVAARLQQEGVAVCGVVMNAH